MMVVQIMFCFPIPMAEGYKTRKVKGETVSSIESFRFNTTVVAALSFLSDHKSTKEEKKELGETELKFLRPTKFSAQVPQVQYELIKPRPFVKSLRCGLRLSLERTVGFPIAICGSEAIVDRVIIASVGGSHDRWLLVDESALAVLSSANGRNWSKLQPVAPGMVSN